MTAKSLRRHSGRGLSGRPPSEPFRFLKRATRCIISSRLQFRISFQSLMAFPPGAIIVPRRSKHADTAARRQPDRLPGRLQLASLGRARDYTVERGGGVLQRFQALMEKKHAATLLLSPFELQAEAKGFKRLGNATDVLGAYQGLVGGARKGWADANRAAVVGYIRAFSEAVDWLYDPRNRDEAVLIFRKNLPNVPEQGAQAAYGVLLAPRSGFQKKAQI